MAYSTTIPAATQQISDSQGDILENFAQLNTQFSVDHTALTASSNNGDHIQLTFPSAQTTKTASGTISYVYPKSDGTNVELYQSTYNISAAASVETQITSAGLPIWKGGTVGTTGIVLPNNGTSGYLNLPNGTQFRWGTATVGSTETKVLFSSNGSIAFSNACLNVQLTTSTDTYRTASVSNSHSLDKTYFYAYAQNNNTSVYYWAIGY